MKSYLGAILAGALAFGTAAYAQTDATSKAKKNKDYGSQEQVQDTKTKSDSGTSKMTKDTIFGKVEAYEMGKSMKITTPGKREGTRTISLSGRNLTANVDPDVKVGEWVSINEQKDNSGHKTITVKKSSEAARTQQEQEQSTTGKRR
jgi:Ni/Co efflux regulator RcnB